MSPASDGFSIFHFRSWPNLQIKEARPSREFATKWATENISPTTGNTIDRWYRDMFAEATAEAAAKKKQ